MKLVFLHGMPASMQWPRPWQSPLKRTCPHCFPLTCLQKSQILSSSTDSSCHENMSHWLLHRKTLTPCLDRNTTTTPSVRNRCAVNHKVEPTNFNRMYTRLDDEKSKVARCNQIGREKAQAVKCSSAIARAAIATSDPTLWIRACFVLLVLIVIFYY